MIHDLEFLQSRMSKLEGSAELSQYLLKIVEGKPVAQGAEKTQEQTEPRSTPDVKPTAEQPAEEILGEKT